jgi:outer membrane protein TolC
MRLVLFLLCVPTIALAQVPATQPAAPQVFTLDQAIQYAVDHYPSVRAALEQVNGSLASVDAAHAAVLPRLDALWQSNRATANNIFGQVLPQSVLPSLTGPVLPSASGDSVWGSATGALLSWEPFDFGLRSATVAGADAAVAQAKASEALTRLEVARIVGAAFLDVVATERAVAAAQADLDRRELLARVVHALVDNELRPGADASRVDAERAAATTRVIRSQEAVALARAALARALGLSNAAVRVDAADLLMRVPTATPAVDAAAGHPLAKVRQAAVGSAEAQEQCWRGRICRASLCNRACSRVAAARTRTARSMGARAASACNA